MDTKLDKFCMRAVTHTFIYCHMHVLKQGESISVCYFNTSS